MKGNAGKSSLKSSNIQSVSLYRVKSDRDVHYGANPLAWRQALPSPITVHSGRYRTLPMSPERTLPGNWAR